MTAQRLDPVLLLATVALVACGTPVDPPAQPAPIKRNACGLEIVDNPVEAPKWQDGDPTGGASGRLVNSKGEPLVDATVLACTDFTCLTSISDAKGGFLFLAEELPAVPHKMQMIPPSDKMPMLIFYQDIKAGQTTPPQRDIIVPEQTEPLTPWPSDKGGEASVANGMVHLKAAPGALTYPLGTPDDQQGVVATRVEAANLPPLSEEPWKASKEPVFAFIINPYSLKSSTPIELKVTGTKVDTGRRYCILAPAPSTANVEYVGDAVADANGDLVAEPNGKLTDLSTLVLFAKQEDGE